MSEQYYYTPMWPDRILNEIQMQLWKVDNPEGEIYPCTIAEQPEYDRDTQTLTGAYPPVEDPENPGHYILHWQVEETLDELYNIKRNDITTLIEHLQKERLTLNLGDDDTEAVGYNEETDEYIETKERIMEFYPTPEALANLDTALVSARARSGTIQIEASNGWFDVDYPIAVAIRQAVADKREAIRAYEQKCLDDLYSRETIADVSAFFGVTEETLARGAADPEEVHALPVEP